MNKQIETLLKRVQEKLLGVGKLALDVQLCQEKLHHRLNELQSGFELWTEEELVIEIAIKEYLRQVLPNYTKDIIMYRMDEEDIKIHDHQSFQTYPVELPLSKRNEMVKEIAELVKVQSKENTIDVYLLDGTNIQIKTAEYFEWINQLNHDDSYKLEPFFQITFPPKKNGYLQKLVDDQSMSQEMARLLDAAVKSFGNILVFGRTGSGKSSLLSGLAERKYVTERIVAIQQMSSFEVNHLHVIRLEASTKVSVNDLVKQAQRMGPDSILVDDLRESSYHWLQAANTGFDGTMATTYGTNGQRAIEYLADNVLTHIGADVPLQSVYKVVEEAIDMLVGIQRLKDGRHIIQGIYETSMNEEKIVAVPIFEACIHCDDAGKETIQYEYVYPKELSDSKIYRKMEKYKNIHLIERHTD